MIIPMFISEKMKSLKDTQLDSMIIVPNPGWSQDPWFPILQGCLLLLPIHSSMVHLLQSIMILASTYPKAFGLVSQITLKVTVRVFS